MEHYAEMRRQCVFSNDELLYRIAEVVAGLREMKDCANYTEMAAQCFRDHDIARRTCFEVEDLRVIHAEFATVVSREISARRRLLPLCARAVRFRIDRMTEHGSSGIDHASISSSDGDGGKTEPEEDEDDDARICAVCQTTLFFSAIACPCKEPNLTSEPSRSTRSKRGSTPGLYTHF